MKTSRAALKRPANDDVAIAPVTILDAEGRVVRVVPATEFQRAAGATRDGHAGEASSEPASPVRLVRARRMSEARSSAAATAPAGPQYTPGISREVRAR